MERRQRPRHALRFDDALVHERRRQSVPRGPIKSQLGAYQLDAAFHTYGCKWDSNGANFYFDGAPMDVGGETISGQTLGSGRIDMAGSYFPNPMFILLQLAFKPGAVPSPSNTTFGESNSLWVDYVRVWDLA